MTERDYFIVAGIACIVVAITGGGLQLFGQSFPVVSSRARQATSGLVGAIFLVVGLLWLDGATVLAGVLDPGEAKKHFKGFGSAMLSAPETLSVNQGWNVVLEVSLDEVLSWDKVEVDVAKPGILDPSDSTQRQPGEPGNACDGY